MRTQRQGSMGVTLGDYNHDGDWTCSSRIAMRYNTLYRRTTGHGSFTDVSYAAKVAGGQPSLCRLGTKFFDYDNDGWLICWSSTVTSTRSYRPTAAQFRSPQQS